MRAIFLFELLFCVIFSPMGFSNVEGDVQLLVAAAEGNLEQAKFLVEQNGADINNTRGSFGMTPLHYALINHKMPQKQCEVASYLISKGANQKIKGGQGNISAKKMISLGACEGRL